MVVQKNYKTTCKIYDKCNKRINAPILYYMKFKDSDHVTFPQATVYKILDIKV